MLSNYALQVGMPTRMAPGKVGLHGRGGLGACGGAAVALVSGLDLPAGEAGASIGAERGLWQCSARNQARDLFHLRHTFPTAFVPNMPNMPNMPNRCMLDAC